jgi:hypothetical protein
VVFGLTGIPPENRLAVKEFADKRTCVRTDAAAAAG